MQNCESGRGGDAFRPVLFWEGMVGKPRVDQTEWPGGWTAERRARFLDALGETGSVRLAVRAAGHVSTSGAYKLRHRDAAFAADWDQAVKDAVARIESDLVARAMEAIEAQKAAPDASGSSTPLAFEQLLQLLKYYRTEPQNRQRRHGPRRHYATRAETDATLMEKLDFLEARVKARRKKEAAARKVAREATKTVAGAKC